MRNPDKQSKRKIHQLGKPHLPKLFGTQTYPIAAPQRTTIVRHKWPLDCEVGIGFPPLRRNPLGEVFSGSQALE